MVAFPVMEFTNGKKIIAMTVLLAAVNFAGAQNACDPMDPGPYLGTQPTLLFAVDEATAPELAASETAGDLKYHSELRLHGVAGIDFDVDSVVTGVVDPLDHLTLVHTAGKNYLKLSNHLDRDGATPSLGDDINVINFLLRCTPKLGPGDRVVYDASLIINDVNDNDPQVSSPGSVSLSEASPVGTVVATVTASDLDLNLDSPFHFSLEEDFEMFSIDNATGKIQLAAPLDFETQDKHFDLKVVVKDGGPTMLRTATTVIGVDVTDADDQGPVFVFDDCVMHNGQCVSPRYLAGRTLTKDAMINFMASTTAGSKQVSIKAKDQDSNAGRTILFKIASTVPSGQESMFSVNTNQGAGQGEYVADIRATSDVTLDDGFQIILVAEEQTANRRKAMALLEFTESMGANSDQQGGSNNNNNNNNNNNGVNDDDDDDDYSDTEIALIVATSVLAAFLLCSIVFIIYSCRKSPSKRQESDVPMEGQSNVAYRL